MVFFDDHASIVQLITEKKIKTIYEFGTWQGYTTLLMASLDCVEKIKTIDACKTKNTEEIARFAKGDKITFEKVDTLSVDIKNDIGKYEMVFIDAGHEYSSVIADTRLALALKPKLIIWHDYCHEHNQVVAAVEYYKKERLLNVISMPKILAYCEPLY
jgi:predicted O-methyltransferase YrrM